MSRFSWGSTIGSVGADGEPAVVLVPTPAPVFVLVDAAAEAAAPLSPVFFVPPGGMALIQGERMHSTGQSCAVQWSLNSNAIINQGIGGGGGGWLLAAAAAAARRARLSKTA